MLQNITTQFLGHPLCHVLAIKSYLIPYLVFDKLQILQNKLKIESL